MFNRCTNCLCPIRSSQLTAALPFSMRTSSPTHILGQSQSHFTPSGPSIRPTKCLFGVNSVDFRLLLRVEEHRTRHQNGMSKLKYYR